MSGGSYDYLYSKMHDASARLRSKNQPLHRRAFGELLAKCADAMFDIEWVDSGDKEEGDDLASIMVCIHHDEILKVSVDEAIEARDKLIELLGCKYKEKQQQE